MLHFSPNHPSAHPFAQIPFMLLQVTLSLQLPQGSLQSFPYVFESQPKNEYYAWRKITSDTKI